MRRLFRKAAQLLAPGPLNSLGRIEEIEARLKTVQEDLATFVATYDTQNANYDPRFDKLKRLAEQIEPYQPAYGVDGIIDVPLRESKERARTIEDCLQPVAGKRVLDIGSSLGYFSHYLADRSASVEGWDSNVQNVEVARGISEINGIAVSFLTKELNEETVKTIEPGNFDAALVLSVFHHITYFKGLEYTQKLVKDLLSAVPILIVELAKKGENEKLHWDRAQPDDEMAIFDLVKDRVTIKKLGEFHNHLSDKTRPMYVVESRKQVTVSSHRYAYNRVVKQAYNHSPVAHTGVGRRYYFGPNFIIKEYMLNAWSQHENLRQILNEVKVLADIRESGIKVHHGPKLLDFEINYPKNAKIAIEKTEGILVSDLQAPLNAQPAVIITKDVLKTLIDLERHGMKHNDVRSWNVIVDPEGRGWLIDYGLVDSASTSKDIVGLLWVVYTMLTNEREASARDADALPPSRPFIRAGKLKTFYGAVEGGERDLKKLYRIL